MESDGFEVKFVMQDQLFQLCVKVLIESRHTINVAIAAVVPTRAGQSLSQQFLFLLIEHALIMIRNIGTDSSFAAGTLRRSLSLLFNPHFLWLSSRLFQLGCLRGLLRFRSGRL